MLRQRTATNQLEHFHFCLLHNDAAHSVRSLAPRSKAERGEGWGEGHFFGAPPSPDPSCGERRAALSPRKRGEGAIKTTALVIHSANTPSFPRRVFLASFRGAGEAREPGIHTHSPAL